MYPPTPESPTRSSPGSTIRPDVCLLAPHPKLECLENYRVHDLGRLHADITNIRAAILRDTAKQLSWIPQYLLLPTAIKVPGISFFSDQFYTDANQHCIEASRALSSLVTKELERIRLMLEEEHKELLKDWNPSPDEAAAALCIAAHLTDYSLKMPDLDPAVYTRESVPIPDYIIRPDFTKGHTLIVPNGELRGPRRTPDRPRSYRRSPSLQSSRRSSQRPRQATSDQESSASPNYRATPASSATPTRNLGFRQGNQPNRRPRT